MTRKHDLERAYACLDQIFFNEDTSLIIDTLMNTSIQLLINYFSISSKKERKNLHYKKVFRSFLKFRMKRLP